MNYFHFRDMVEEIVVHSWKQNCMGPKSCLDVEALVYKIDKALQEESQTEEVMNWMRRMEDPRYFQFHLKEKILSKGKQCCFRWCPNLKSPDQLSMEADKFLQDVAELLKKIKRTYEEALSKTEQKVAAAAVKEFMHFNSRRDVWDEIMVALQSPRISSIGVHGEAGVGKTMLVEEIKRKAQQLKLFDDVVMAKVSNNPDMRRIQEDIAHDLGLELSDSVTAAGRIKSRLTDRKFLVILDDIWARIDLEEVGIPFRYKHKQKLKQPIKKKNKEISSVQEQTECILLMTSKDRDVLSHEMDAQKIIKVDGLKEEDARKLFVATAGEQAKRSISQHTEMINEIVKEGNPLPIAIATVASTLKDESLIPLRTIKKLCLQLSRESEVNNWSRMSPSLYSAIKLGYDDLESKQLKQTLLLCTLMGHNAGLQDLLKYGIGLELFPAGANSIEAARDEAVILVKRLRDSSFLLDGGSNVRFDMHDPIRGVAMSIASGDHDLLALREDAAKGKLDKKELQKSKWIYLSDVDAAQLPYRLKCPELTFFHLVNKNPDLEIPVKFFEGAKGLRVMGLTKMHFSSTSSLFSPLKNLHTLCLDQSKLGKILVSIMGDLKNLQVLSLVGCDIEELPQETEQLAKLKLLDLSDCTKLQVIPPGILKSLSQLEELYLGNSFDQWEEIKKHDESTNASLDELRQLKKLTSLEVRIPDINMIPDGLFSIELIRYKIFIGDVWNHWGSYFKHSKTLKLKHDGSIRSDEVKQLPNKVEELHLEKLNGVKDVINDLDQNGFQELKCLHVKNIDLEIEHLFFNPKKEIYSEVLPKLEELFLHNLKRLQKIFHGLFEKESLKQLRIITVTGCSRLKNLFSFSLAKQLLCLQEIRVTDCNNIVEIVDDEEKEDANDITAEATDNVIELAAQIQCLRLQNLKEFISFSQEKIVRSMSTSLFSKKPVAEGRIWNLTKLIIEGCDQLENLFSKSIAACLEKLQHLEIRECKKMKEIIASDAFSKYFTFEFPSLKQLAIENCPELNGFVVEESSIGGTALFNRWVHFPALETMSISKLKNLNTIWWKFTSFRFGSLNFLHIKDLPNLIRLCQYPDNQSFQRVSRRFSSLEQLIIENCPQLNDSLFDEEFEFPELKIMTISHLENLKIIQKNLAKDSFCKLRSLRVTYCQNLSTISPCNSGMLKRLLGSLKELEITGCTSVREVFELGQSDITRRTVAAAEYKLIFQQLEAITIADCPNMVTFATTFSRHQQRETSEPFLSTKVEFPNLELLVMKNCHRFKYLMTLSTVQSFLQLKNLEIRGCEKMEEVIMTEKFTENRISLFPKLDSMELKDLPELTRFCSQPQDLPVTALFVFPEVTDLKLSKLPKLASFFPKNATEWPKLTSMHVCECHREQIFAWEFPPGGNQLKSQTQHPLFWVNKVEFSKLELLVVEGCGRLKYLMTLSMVQRFLQLKKLVIRGCEKIEEVIMTEKFTENRISLFPKLDNMELEDLPELTGFCSQPQDLPVTTLFVFPEVTNLKFSKLPKLASFLPNNATEWPKLTSMHVCECDHVQIFALEFPNGGNQLESQTQHPLFWVKKVEFSKLELLVVEGCGRLKYLMTLSTVQSLLRLKRLVIRGCEKMEEVIMTEKFTENWISLFPKLDIMELEDLPELTRFCSQPEDLPVTTSFVFPEVTNLKFSKLPKLASFLPNNATEWPKLTSMHVCECDHVQIFALEFPNGGNQLESQTQHPLFWVKKVEFSKLELLVVEGCGRLKYLMTPSTVQSFLRLKRLVIRGCEKMEEVIMTEKFIENRISLFPKLDIMELEDLPELTRFCSQPEDLPVTTLFVFPEITNLKFSKLPKLASFLPNNATEWPKLTSMHVCECDHVQIFALEFPNRGNQLESQTQHPLFWVKKVEFSKLELLVVEGCGRLKYLMTLSMVQRFLRLKRLVMRGCEKMEEVIMTEKFTENRISLFPKLDIMELEDLPELTRFCSQPEDLPVTTLFFFPEVTNLKFSKLPKLASFLPNNATEWPKLTSMHVCECDHVQIFALEFPNGGNQLESQTQHPLFWVNKGLKGQEGSSGSNSAEFPAISFVNLRTLEVSRCHGLITLLRYTIAKRLAKLSTMSITDCSKLEEIVACEGNEGKDEIVFTQLTSLRLVLLSRLESFCSGKCNFSFPSLHEVILSECPKMSTFSKGVVKTETLQKVKLTEEDDVGIWKDGNLNSSIQHLFINKALSSILVCTTGKNAGGANAINVDIEKENGQEKEENEDNGFDVNEPKGEIYVSLDDSDPSVAQDAQESASKREEVVLSSKEMKRGEEAPIVSQYAQEQASKRGEWTPIVVRDAQELAKKRAEVASSAQCITSRLLGNYTIEEESKELSKSVGFDTVLLEKASELKSTLSKIEGLTEDEKDTALSRLPDHPLQMLVFYSLSPDQRLAWVRRFLIDH